MKKKAMRREIRILTEENRQLRRYTLLTSVGIILGLLVSLTKVIRKH